MKKSEYILLLLDGEEPSKALIDRFVGNAVSVIATDGAAKYAAAYNIPLDIIIGDMDSISADLRKYFHEKATLIIEEPDQNSNDFEKALKYILKESLLKDVIVLGIHGKRTDHLLTNFSVMLRFTDVFESLIAYDATHEHHFLTTQKNKYSFDLRKATQISLTPLPEAEGVKTSGLHYPISKERMIFGQREGLGNIISEVNASIEITDGALLISVPYSNQ